MTDNPVLRHLTDDEQVMLPADEADPQLTWAGVHLASCASCHEARARLAAVMAAVVRQPLTEPPDGFERVIWARVGTQLARSPRSGWRAWWAAPRLALAGGAAAVALAAFLAGRWYQPATPAVTQEMGAAAVASVVPDQVLLGTASDHLERSQAVLVELLNTRGGEPLDRADRTRAADLVAASRLIRQSAVEAGETSLATVLDDLERVLVEMANDGDRWSPAERDVLRARIESRGLLFRTRVVGADVRQRVTRWN